MKMRKHWWISMLAVLALIVTACASQEGSTSTAGSGGATSTVAGGGGMDLSGTEVTILGSESSEDEGGAVQDALDVFAKENNMTITFTGVRDFSDQINAQAAGGNPPDLAFFPQPGKVKDFANDGFILPIPSDVEAVVDDNWAPEWKDFVTFDGTLWGVPNKSDLKSLVWYNVAGFNDGGYDIPETWDELLALTNTMIADGNTPWCVGIESGPATGWPFTDWVEDLMLRFDGPDVYDQWVNHEIPFNDSRVVDVFNKIGDLWNEPGAVYAAGGSIAATPFGDNGQPLADGTCLMHRQANFFAAFLPDGTQLGADGDVNTFYFPAVDPATKPVLVAGTNVAAFNDRPEVWEVMKYMASGDYATNRQKAQQERKGGSVSGFLSANLNQDLSAYLPFEQDQIKVLQTADPARYDGSDLMPAAVGSGAFWTEATSFVNGDETAQQAADNIEAAWPADG